MTADVTFLVKTVSLTEEPVISWISRHFYIWIKADSLVLTNQQTQNSVVHLDPWTYCQIHSFCLFYVSQACCPHLHWDLCVSVCLCLSLHLLPSLFVCLSVSLSLCLPLSPWPVWSVIEGAVFTWPTGMEGTLCALWRQIALLAPPSLYLSFTSLLLLLLSSYSAHPFTTLLVSPLYHHSPRLFPPHPHCLIQLFHLLLQSFNRFEILTLCCFNIL